MRIIPNLLAIALISLTVSCKKNPAESAEHKALIVEHETMMKTHTEMEKQHSAISDDPYIFIIFS